MKINSNLILVFFIWIYQHESVICQTTFMIPFQPLVKGSFSPSIDEWIEFTNQISPSKEFTACHWIRPKYFNKRIAINLWSYCTLAREGDLMGCLQIGLHGSQKTANRDVEIKAWIPYKNGYVETTHLIDNFLQISLGLLGSVCVGGSFGAICESMVRNAYYMFDGFAISRFGGPHLLLGTDLVHREQ